MHVPLAVYKSYVKPVLDASGSAVYTLLTLYKQELAYSIRAAAQCIHRDSSG